MGSHIALAVVAVALLGASRAQAAGGCVDQARAAFDAKFPALYGPDAAIEQVKSLQVVEQESLAWVANCVHCPQKPFGNANGKWEAFKQLVRPADCVVRFSTNPRSWERQQGQQGYALIREGSLVKTFLIMRN